MRFDPASLPGAWVIELERIEDERGWFARSFDAAEFRARGLVGDIVQANVSFNPRAGTLRGMHYQAEPHGEPKLVRCSRGRVYDVAVDLRPESPTRCAWHAVELSPDNDRLFYIPPGLAHGFQTLEPDCQVDYLMGHEYVPGAGRGVRFDDPAFAIAWPPTAGPRIVSPRDLAYPDFPR